MQKVLLTLVGLSAVALLAYVSYVALLLWLISGIN